MDLKRPIAAIVALLVVLATGQVFAGTFRINYANTISSRFTINTEAKVGTEAEYVGEVDSDDNTWKVDTKLTVNYGSVDQTYWGSPIYGGHDSLKQGLKVVISPNQHGAFASFENCGWDNQPADCTGYGQSAILSTSEFQNVPDGPYTTECNPEESGTDGGGDGDGGGDTQPDPPCYCTPVLLDLNGQGFRLTDEAGGVEFDLDGDGVAERLAWTEAGIGDAFLALDRNSNGRIDDGGELFGDFTEQPASATPHGYKALAVFDSADRGGNGDGIISRDDAVFVDLLLWVDSDHDGVSQAGELTRLAESEIEWIDLDIVESRRKDRYGNEFRYKGNVRLTRGVTHSVDVFFLKE